MREVGLICCILPFFNVWKLEKFLWMYLGNLLDCFIFVWSEVFSLCPFSLWWVCLWNHCRKAHCVWGCSTHSFELRVGPGGAIDHIACPCRKDIHAHICMQNWRIARFKCL
jgi:hypothetical protein